MLRYAILDPSEEGVNGCFGSAVRHREQVGRLAEAFPLETVQAILAGDRTRWKAQEPASCVDDGVTTFIALGLFVGVGAGKCCPDSLMESMWIWPNEVRVATASAITQARNGWANRFESLSRSVRFDAKKLTRDCVVRALRVISLDGFPRRG